MPTQNNNLPHPDLDFVFVEGGQFMMGSNERDDEKPMHSVTISDFYMCKYLVTQSLYEWVTKEDPSNFKGKRRPVEMVSWDGAQNFIKKLNAKEEVQSFLARAGKENMTFRLPSEAEWEFAAKGGNRSQGYIYSGSDKLKQVAWFHANSEDETKEVGLLLQNELGLYDMSGNLWEWCEDDWHDNYHTAPTDGSSWIDTPERSIRRILRGGYYFDKYERYRPAYRTAGELGQLSRVIGFRPVIGL